MEEVGFGLTGITWNGRKQIEIREGRVKNKKKIRGLP
jgi:hypothetical protein